MLVQKKSQKRNIILGATVAVLIVVTILVLTLGSKTSNTNTEIGFQNDSIVKSSAIVDIDSTFFGEKDVVGLRDRSGQNYVEQTTGAPTDFQIIPAPKGVYMLNPQVGEKLILYWDFNSRYTTVRIYRSESQEEKGELIAEISDKNYYQDLGITNGVYYHYTLISVGVNDQKSDDSIKLSGSPTDIFPPQSPVGIAVADLGDGSQIKISWLDSRDKDFAYIRIYRSQIEGELGTLILDEIVEGNSYVDKNILEDVEYFYTVTAVDSSKNESEKSVLPVGGNSNPFQPIF